MKWIDNENFARKLSPNNGDENADPKKLFMKEALNFSYSFNFSSFIVSLKFKVALCEGIEKRSS
jgi:hypothetical protein